MHALSRPRFRRQAHLLPRQLIANNATHDHLSWWHHEQCVADQVLYLTTWLHHDLTPRHYARTSPQLNQPPHAGSCAHWPDLGQQDTTPTPPCDHHEPCSESQVLTFDRNDLINGLFGFEIQLFQPLKHVAQIVWNLTRSIGNFSDLVQVHTHRRDLLGQAKQRSNQLLNISPRNTGIRTQRRLHQQPGNAHVLMRGKPHQRSILFSIDTNQPRSRPRRTTIRPTTTNPPLLLKP